VFEDAFQVIGDRQGVDLLGLFPFDCPVDGLLEVETVQLVDRGREVLHPLLHPGSSTPGDHEALNPGKAVALIQKEGEALPEDRGRS